MTTEPVRHPSTGDFARGQVRLVLHPKPTEIHDHVATIAARTNGFLVERDRENGWVCIPLRRSQAMGYGSTVFLAIADAARQLEAQEAHR